MSRLDSSQVREIVRACGFALATAEFALARRIDSEVALEAIATELDLSLQGLSCSLRCVARVDASSGWGGNDN